MRWAPLLVVLLSSCDWEHFALVNSIPVARADERQPPLHLFLCADGVSAAAMDEAQQQGAFLGFARATLIPMFPATSDASWSRLFHTPRLTGYEFTAYDGERDEVVNPGLGGGALHFIPALEGAGLTATGPAGTPAYYRVFDTHGSDYVDAVLSYTEPRQAFGRALDSLFFVLGGRLATDDVFVAYLLETDVTAHVEARAKVVELLVALSRRLDEFRRAHPERPLEVTLFTDHGNDHAEKPVEHAVYLGELMSQAGVRNAKSFADGHAGSSPWAVMVEHTRTTYGAAHTDVAEVPEVARRLSAQEAVDLVVARGAQPPGAPAGTAWVELWRRGLRSARFGYVTARDAYLLERAGDWAAFGVTLEPGAGDWVEVADAALFEATVRGPYPDVVFRARTALEPVSVRFPADVLVSLAPGWQSAGFALPGSRDLGLAGSHGAMREEGSRGVLLTTSRALPEFVRSDDVLALFPALTTHAEGKGLTLEPGAAGASLP